MTKVAIEKRLQHLKKNRRNIISGFLWLAPSLIGMVIFYVGPYIEIVRHSLIDNPVRRNFVFLDNFIDLFSNHSFITGARNTLVFSVIAVPLAVVLSLLIALMLEARIPFKSYFRTFFLSPLMVPVASVVLIWQVLFHNSGAVNELTMALGLDRIDWMRSEFSPIVVIVLFLWRNLGFFMILFMAALNNIPRELLETADVEGAGPFTKLFAIKMRYLSPTLLFVTILALINSFRIFREVHLLTGNIPYGRLYMIQHFMNNIFHNLNYQRLAAAAVVMTVIMVIIIAVLFVVENRYGRDVEE